MAVRYAVASGNWSATGTWNGGTLPTSADDVYTNNFTVTVDQDVTVLSLRNTSNASPAVTAGGTFAVSTNRTIAATSGGVFSNLTAVITTSSTAVVTITGAINWPASGGTCITHGSSGLLTITSNLVVGTGWNNASHITCTSGPVSVTGNLVGGGGNAATCCITSSGASATVTVVGNVTGGTVGGAAIICSGASAVVTVTGNVTSVAGIATVTPAISLSGNSLSKWHNIVGTVTATNTTGVLGSNGIVDTNTGGGGVTIAGSMVDSSQGDVAIYARRLRCTSTLNTTRQQTNSVGYPNGGMVTFGSLDYIPNNIPVPTDVRYGTVYGNNSYTGTCRVPAAASVAYGVLVDATSGTAALAPSDVAALVGAQIAAALTAVP